MEEPRGEFDLDFTDDGNRHVEEEEHVVVIGSSTRTASTSTASKNDTIEFEKQDRIKFENEEEADEEADDCYPQEEFYDTISLDDQSLDEEEMFAMLY